MSIDLKISTDTSFEGCGLQGKTVLGFRAEKGDKIWLYKNCFNLFSKDKKILLKRWEIND
jgi:hypothetical protein